jgi:hypothetical protein
MNDKETLSEKIRKRVIRDNAYERYGFLRNPFPKAGESTAEPFFDQEEARRVFEEKLLAFLESEGRKSTRLLIHGDHRVGKTNFLRYWYQSLQKSFSEIGLTEYFPILLTVSSDNFIDDIHKPIAMELSQEFFSEFFIGLEINSDALELAGDSDFKRAINSVLEDKEHQLIFTKWFSGEKCTQNELTKLGGVFSSITTASLAIKYFDEFMKLARRLGMIKAFILFVDEFELIFSDAVTRSKKARYLQDLRHFMDVHQQGIFLIAATTSYVLTEFQRQYIALKNRFGDPVELKPIQNYEDSLGYARAYMEHGHEAFKRFINLEGPDDFDELVSEKDIKNIFEEVEREYRGVQGWFFAKLHERAEDKIRNRAPL